MKHLWATRIGLLAAVMWISSTLAASAAQSVSVGWDLESNAAGYYLYYGNVSGMYTEKVDTGTNTMAQVSNLKEGQTYYFAVSAYDTNGFESELSGEISYLVPGVLLVNCPSSGSAPAQLRFPVASSRRYEVQASQDLASWTTIWESTSTSNAWVNFVDPQAGALGKRFYKLLLH